VRAVISRISERIEEGDNQAQRMDNNTEDIGVFFREVKGEKMSGGRTTAVTDNEEGYLIFTDPEEVKDALEATWQKLYTKEQGTRTPEEEAEFEILYRKVKNVEAEKEMEDTTSEPFTMEDLEVALNEAKPTSAVGEDKACYALMKKVGSDAAQRYLACSMGAKHPTKFYKHGSMRRSSSSQKN
jgi:hypothetical protein